MIFRLTIPRAQKILGGVGVRPGRRRKVKWVASRWDRKTHPDLAEGAWLDGGDRLPEPARTGRDVILFHDVESEAQTDFGPVQTALEYRNRSAQPETDRGLASGDQ
jgi:hypothetical protein